MFTTVIITQPFFVEGEARRIADFLRTYDLVHIRKPESKRDEVEALLQDIPSEFHGRIVLHEHFELARTYRLFGLHTNSRNPVVPDDYTGNVSRSLHSLSEVATLKAKYSYVSLSPIFDSISKKGYLSAFTTEELAAARAEGIIDSRVFALGGVTFDLLPKVKAMGFGGAMILGDAWK